MIPEAKSAAVARALRETFGVGEFEDIRMLTAGLSTALVFRMVVRGCPYLLRIITRTDAMNDPTRQFACMKSAAAAGLAPRVWYTSTEDRISITDFVDARPFPRTEALALLPVTLKTLHALPPFPRMIVYRDYFDALDGYVRKFQAAKILPESETDELFQRYARVQSIYPRHDSEMVSSHNDLKPENILFDGTRVWLVDWEAAFLNDPYTDLAVAANFVVINDADEEIYLRNYFGEAVSEYRLARFYLMRQALHMFYAMIFLLLGSSGKPIERNAKAPDFRDFHDGIWTGEISLAGAEMKLQYGRVHMNQVLRNMRTVRFHDAIRIVYDCHVNA
ncbi:MAG TPA: phosphotransferase [Candidatus Sulfotelmatobacter sp.]|nr:phosphotransferase [Candidatus Sulfotelmatobacter sp.]